MRVCLIIGFVFALASGSAIAQSVVFPRTTNYHIEAGTYIVEGNQMPFWLRANQFGVVPLETGVSTARVGLSSDYRKPIEALGKINRKRFDWGYGLELVGNLTDGRQQLLIPEAYAKVRYEFIELMAGRRKEIFGLVDTTLTSGSYVWSGNALPIPKIQIGTTGFTPIPLTRQLLAFHALYNHGWFSNSGMTQDFFLHQKLLYLRLGKPEWKLKLYGGLNHQAQWGGYSPILNNAVSNNGYLPSSLRDYWLMIRAFRGANRVDPTLTTMEENRIGNHLGSVDVAAELQLGTVSLMAYRQSVYDDGSLYFLTNIADGLNGIRLQNRKAGGSFFSIREVLTEFLYTKSQGGSIFVLEFGQDKLRGRDDYFNHSQYLDGWAYDGRGIGTPFIAPQTELRPEFPQTYKVFTNNRVAMFHAGISGVLGNRVEWQSRISYSKNYGTYNRAFETRPTQFSAQFMVSAPINLPVLGQMSINSTLAVDRGELLPTSSGVYIGLRKTFRTGPPVLTPDSTVPPEE